MVIPGLAPCIQSPVAMLTDRARGEAIGWPGQGCTSPAMTYGRTDGPPNVMHGLVPGMAT
jgi:hypothetical protein